MPDEIDKSLLDRLQALRGVSAAAAAPVGRAEHGLRVDLVEGTRTPTREDALAARLRSLREHDGLPSRCASNHAAAPVKGADSGEEKTRNPIKMSSLSGRSGGAQVEGGVAEKKQMEEEEEEEGDNEEKGTEDVEEGEKGEQDGEGEGKDEDLDAVLQTDMHLLEEMLADVGIEPDAEQVRALLDDIARTIPSHGEEIKRDSVTDGSDAEQADREADDLIARFRDEIDLEAAADRDAPHPDDADALDGSSIPSLPLTLDQLQHKTSASPRSPTTTATSTTTTATTTAPAATTGIDDITARLALLRAPITHTSSQTSQHPPSRPPARNPAYDNADADAAGFGLLPCVPSDAPSSARRLTSTTGYTDDDADGWCIVCLEDATLLCPACDDDVYCVRCWREMHVGPAAAFDERSHKAVYLGRVRRGDERGVMLGA